MRLAFLGTPEFALPSLRLLHEAGHEIALVLSQPDRPRGRGLKLQASPVRGLAMELGLPNAALAKGQRQEIYTRLLGLGLDAVIVVAFGHILREPILSGTPYGCINVHASLLPRWRGPAPIHRALMAGDTRTGVSIMRLDAGVDTGPVYLRRETPIDPLERSSQLHDRLAKLGAELLLATLDRIVQETLLPEDQTHEEARHAPLLVKEEGSARFDRPALDVHNRVRALQPWPSVTVLHGERRLKLLRGHVIEPDGGIGWTPSSVPGEVLRVDAQGLAIACAQSVYLLEELQPEAKGPMAAAAYARGAGVTAGERLLPLPGFREIVA